MAEGREQQPPVSGDTNESIDADVGSQGGEGRRQAEASPPIADDAERGQTQTPAPADEVGVPPDEEMGPHDEEDPGPGTRA
jgi:hypothetical protein